MAFDYKKAYKEFYLPPRTPGIVTVPAMNFLAVRGQGDPNQEGGAYKQALELLYAVAYTIKMSKMGQHRLEGYFDYVVPPLEGLWWQEGVHGVDYARKASFQWISLIRLPEFVTEDAFDWAVRAATEKKQRDCSAVEFISWDEGLCVQCMHIGPYLSLLRSGNVDFPPLVSVNGVVIDGLHRFWAYQQMGYQTVTVYQNKPWAMPAAA